VIGAKVRNALGPRLSRRAGRAYRSIFVDLAKEAAALAELVPPGAHLLDVGGGDGEPLNHLLALRADVRVTSLDPMPVVGQWIEARFADRVSLLPRTSLSQYLAAGAAAPDAILLADVMHHIPSAERAAFLQLLGTLLARRRQLVILVKDVEPGHWRARLGFWSDRYITGDRHVSPVSRASLVQLLEQALGPLRCEETALYRTDPPNYAMKFFR
jgi:cyclopropane fatty-acyl-phospholipid synthase-like methyltransferase